MNISYSLEYYFYCTLLCIWKHIFTDYKWICNRKKITIYYNCCDLQTNYVSYIRIDVWLVDIYGSFF